MNKFTIKRNDENETQKRPKILRFYTPNYVQFETLPLYPNENKKYTCEMERKISFSGRISMRLLLMLFF